VFGSPSDQDPCGLDAWASDFLSGQIPNSTNRITISDLTSFLAPVRRLDTSPPDADFSSRLVDQALHSGTSGGPLPLRTGPPEGLFWEW
jgi:hypothetical protein